MATKNVDLFIKTKYQKNNDIQQFTNLNLNQNNQFYANLPAPIQSSFNKTNFNKNSDQSSVVFNNTKKEGCSKIYKNESNLKNQNFIHKNEENKKSWINQISSPSKTSSNNSTLFLHISAYENSMIEISESNKNIEKVSIKKSPKLQDPFEYPRQMEVDSNKDDGANRTPEVMQFKASQKLLSQNQDFETPKRRPNLTAMRTSISRRLNDSSVNTSTTTNGTPPTTTGKDFAAQNWNAKVDTLWPWKEATLNGYKKKVDISSFYSPSGPEKSPYGSSGATKLILQMHSIFNKISEMAAENKITIEDAMTYASMYRKAIRKTTEEICQHSNSSDEAFYGDSLIVANTVFGLVESILIRPYNRSVVADLVEWAYDTFGQAREFLAEIEKQAAIVPRIEEKDFYWTTVVTLILVGQFQSAAKVLSLASDARQNMKIQRMMNLLQLFDYEGLHADQNGDKILYAQKQVQKYKDTFIDDEALNFIANMLLGDIGTFKQASESLSRQWFELLPAYILFTNPAATVNDLSDLTMELYNAIGVNTSQSHAFLNKFIISLMKMQWIEALHDLASVASLLWLSVHLFDLILKIDDSRSTDEIEAIRDTVFITYSKEIFRTSFNPKLIPCAVTYAFATKEFKYEYVEPFLSLIAENDGPNSPELIEILMKICQEYGLYRAAYEITLALSCLALRQKDWSTAIYWAIQNESIEIMETIAYFVLLNAPPAAIKGLNIFKDENEIINQSDAMKFLLHFHQYNVSLEERDIPKATGLLHDLIISNLAPPEFIHVLFDNIADVIDATNRCLDKEPLLNPDAITKLQRCLTLFQTQEVIRIQGSAKKCEQYDKVDKKLTYLHSVLLNALALTALKK